MKQIPFKILVLCHEVGTIVKERALPMRYQCLTGTVGYEDKIDGKKSLLVPISEWSTEKFPVKLTSLLLNHHELETVVFLDRGIIVNERYLSNNVVMVNKCISSGQKTRTMKGTCPMNVSQVTCTESRDITADIINKSAYSFYQTMEYMRPNTNAYTVIVPTTENYSDVNWENAYQCLVNV